MYTEEIIFDTVNNWGKIYIQAEKSIIKGVIIKALFLIDLALTCLVLPKNMFLSKKYLLEIYEPIKTPLHYFQPSVMHICGLQDDQGKLRSCWEVFKDDLAKNNGSSLE